MFRCPFFMQLRGEKNDPPICFCLSKVELQRQQVRQMWFPVPPRGSSGVPKAYKNQSALSLACPETTRGNAELPQLAPTPQFLQMSKLLLSLRLNTTTIQRKRITASCIFLLYFMSRGERWNTQMTK